MFEMARRFDVIIQSLKLSWVCAGVSLVEISRRIFNYNNFWSIAQTYRNYYSVSSNIWNTWSDVLLWFSNLNGLVWRSYNLYFIIFQTRQKENTDDLFYSLMSEWLHSIIIKTRAIEIRMPIMYATRSISLSFYVLNFFCVWKTRGKKNSIEKFT